MTIRETGNYVPIDDFDDLEAPEYQQPSCWQRWRGRVVSLVGTAGSVVLRALDISPLTNAVGSIATGFFFQGAISSGKSGVSLAKTRQICLTTFGQVALFGVSQAYANDRDRKAQIIFTHTIMALLGANMQLVANWLYQEGAVRVESHAYKDLPGERFPKGLVNENVSHALKILASGGLTAAAFLDSDPVLKALSAFGATFFGCQVVGERVLIFVDGKIEKNDSTEGTRYRALKTALTSLAYVVIPLTFIPWSANPDSSTRLSQLKIVGAVLGVFDGILGKSKMARIENCPIEQLEEFKLLDDLNEQVQSKSIPGVAYRIWKVATPVLAVSGLIGFVIWQEGFSLEYLDSKIALGSMLGGFLSSYSLAKVADKKWDPSARHLLKDKLILFFAADSRILGVDPLYLYLAGTNALSMNNHAIEAQKSPFRRVAIISSWVAYGLSMGREFYVTSNHRIGSAPTKFPLMALVNGAITAKLNISGKIR
ncbi:MAG: hypothetical protein COT80_00360 [Candidatus Buchananbacteria bacterium CG10_big_fil_rev_8_21_14_0_10_33_19]|uniref:Uncharacterized protein n=1 Tax=Candidatus Buchananbacteria bacterium CG10_big_fil_rev_8_21_14_0_10_33_19 TaxID=1974525 RepID=A0A2H0W599_9BACT|nr:MAG: hypothetical protein COT80_00360 [Candidatus Buchananbacteria bacterium CG10_big_fil_rev_8_21_14_0_10_33_19]